MARRRTVDEHVVEMRFNNEDFEKKSRATMATLDNLREKLKFDGAGKGLDKLSESMKNASNNASFTGIIKGLDDVGVKFSALQTISDTVWRSITNSAINASKKIVSSLNAPINQIIEGGKRRAQNIEQAKFQLKGLGVTWEEIKDDLDYGVQDTAYGLDSAAKAASQLVASQVKLGEDMRTALRGISGVAAMTNSEYDEIAHIYTTVAGNGRLMGQQLTQLSTKGFNAAATIGKYMGKTEAEIREMVSKGKISFKDFAAAMDDAFGEHAKDANKTFSGALSNTKAALSRLGADVATTGFEALRQILVEIIPVLKGLKQQMAPIENVLGEKVPDIVSVIVKGLKKIDGLVQSSEFGYFIRNVSYGLSNALSNIHASFKRFVDLDGVENVLHGFVNIFEGIMQVIRPLRMALHDVFPKTFTNKVESLSSRFKNFTKQMWLTADAQQGLRKVFTALLHPIKTIIGWIEKLTGYSGKFVIAIHDMIDAVLSFIGLPEAHQDNPLYKIFNNEIVKMIAGVIPMAIQKVITTVQNLWNKLKEIWDKVKELPEFQEILNDIKTVGGYVLGLFIAGLKKIAEFDLAEKINVDGVVEAISRALKFLTNLKKNIVEYYDKSIKGETAGSLILASFKATSDGAKKMTANVSKAFDKSDMGTKLSTFKESLLGIGDYLKGGIVNINNFLTRLSAGKIILSSFGIGLDILIFNLADLAHTAKKAVIDIGGAFKAFSSVTKGLGKALKSFATRQTIEAVIFGIIGIAGSLAVLSLVDSDKLKNAALTLTSVMVVLAGFIFALSYVTDDEIMERIKALGKVILKLGETFALLSIAVALLGALDDEQVDRGLNAILSLSIIVGGLAVILSKFAKNMLSGAGSLVLFSVAIGMLAGTLITLSMFSGPKMDSAIGALWIIFIGFGGLSALIGRFGAGMAKATGAVIAIAASLFILALTLEKLTVIDWNALKENIGAIAIVLVTFVSLAGIMAVLGQKGGMQGGIGLLAMATSLAILAFTISELGKIKYTEIGKGILVLLSLAGVVALLTAIAAKTGPSNANMNMFMSLVSIAGAIWIISKSIMMIADLETDKLKIALKTMVTIFSGLIILVGLMAFLSAKIQKVDWKLLAGIGVIVAGVAISLAVLATVSDTESLLVAGVSLMLSLLGMGILIAAISLLKFDSKKVLSLAVLAASLAVVIGTIGYTLSTLAAFPIDQIMVAALSLVGVIAIIAGITYMLDKIEMDSFVKLGAVAISLIAASTGILVMAAALTVLASIPLNQLAVTVVTIIGLFTFFGFAGEMMLGGLLSAAAGLIALGLGLTAMTLPVLSVAAAIFLFGSGCAIATYAIITLIEALPTLAEKFMEFLRIIRDNAEEMGSIGADIAVNLMKGLLEGFGKWLAAVLFWPAYIAKGIIAVWKDIFKIESPSKVMTSIGGYILEGLIKGLSIGDKIKKLKDTVIGIGSKIIGWLKKKLDINSPSKAMEKIASYSMDGLIAGFSDDNKLKSALGGVGDDIVSGLDGMDLTAGVTPVLDMDNFDTSGLDNADLTSIMNGSGDYSIATTTAVSSEEMTKYFQDSIRINNNILTEMQGMRRDMNTLGTKVNNLKVYINKNALVGEIAPAINQSLGTSYNRSARAQGATRNAIKKRYG